MKAIDLKEFGDFDVLKLVDVPEPQLRPHDLLVRNHATAVNRADLTHRRGGYGRVDFGDSELLGLEIAGEVIGIGSEAWMRIGADADAISLIGAPVNEALMVAWDEHGPL